MTKHRETVDRLIRLATNKGASEHEARTAAMQAVKLIDEHKMLEGGGGVGLPDEVLRLENARLKREVRKLQIALAAIPADLLLSLFKRGEAEEEEPGIPGRRKGPEPTWTQRIDPNHRILIQIFRGGTCQWCGKKFRAGSDVYWNKRGGAVHPACRIEELHEQHDGR